MVNLSKNCIKILAKIGKISKFLCIFCIGIFFTFYFIYLLIFTAFANIYLFLPHLWFYKGKIKKYIFVEVRAVLFYNGKTCNGKKIVNVWCVFDFIWGGGSQTHLSFAPFACLAKYKYDDDEWMEPKATKYCLEYTTKQQWPNIVWLATL